MTKYWIILSAFALGFLIILNTTLWPNGVIGLLLGVAYLTFNGALVATLLPTSLHPIGRFLAGILLWLAALTLVSGSIYRLWRLDQPMVLAIITLLPLPLIWLQSKLSAPRNITIKSIPQPNLGWRTILPIFFGLAVFISATLAVSVLINSSTDEAIRSPWQVVPPVFFSLIFIMNLLAALFFLLPANKKFWQNLAVLAVLTLLTLGVGLIIYRVGFGFDSFIHQATESLILQNGIVAPKPWYYLGQYGLVTILATMLTKPIILVDTLLLPILTAITLPLLVLWSLNEYSRDENSSGLTAFMLLSLPLTAFVATTPQGLANLLLLAIIFLTFGRAYLSGSFRFLLWGLAAAALITHPLAGLPAIMLLALIEITQEDRLGKYKFALASIFSLPIIPLLFALQDRLRFGAATAVSTLPTVQAEATTRGLFYLQTRFNLIMDTIYLYHFNLGLIVAGIAALGLFILWRQKLLLLNLAPLTLAVILGIDSLILKYILPFNFLIDYERGYFAARLFEIAWFFLLPYATVALLYFARRLRQASPLFIIFFASTLAVIQTIGLYTTYPRFDTYSYDRGYSTSQADLDIVNLIEYRSKEPHIVLADQAVSAAALRELGFKKYFLRADKNTGEQIFFYPIPTSGSLYQQYLKMVYEKPSRANAEEAMNLAGVDEAYFVLNDYWFESAKIAATAEKEADESFSYKDGKIKVYRYQR